MKAKIFAAAVCAAALASGAQAAPALQGAMIQIDDVSENVVLLLNGIPHNFNGDGISDFSLLYSATPGQLDPQEFLSFHWAGGIPGTAFPPVYVQLTEAVATHQVISDEFLLMQGFNSLGLPGYLVTFTSADAQLLQIPGGITPTVLPELPQWQTVGFVDNLNGAVDTFQVMSVPEPESYAMLLAGLGLLGFMARRRAKTPA